MPDLPELSDEERAFAERAQEYSMLFDKVTFDRHMSDENHTDLFRPGSIDEALQSLADVANKCRYMFIQIMILAEAIKDQTGQTIGPKGFFAGGLPDEADPSTRN